MLTIKVNDLKQLHDLDDAQWLEETVSLLKKASISTARFRSFNRGIRGFRKREKKYGSQPVRKNYPSFIITAILDKGIRI